ncbi:MAG TPA: tRNA (N6-isopentenyl adenosine(37)-C2)-methylthiotransferase MiaB [Candidatus Polarisedimenticolia bacterium]
METWGCQMNEHDSEKMAGVLQSLGLRAAPNVEEADVILLNTCSVREKAAHKVFTRLGQLKRHKTARPHTVLGVCGCVAQQEQERIFARAPYVDLVMGPRRLDALPELIEDSRRRRRALAVFDPKESLVPENEEVLRVSRTRAYVTVMEGCNKNCTFCIVPFTRGREVCRAPEAILGEARRCVAGGLIEIELLGQNVNAWHHPGGGGQPWDFTRLLGAVARVPGVRRVRFTTSHPLHFKNSIIEAMAAHDAICHHLHLPVQSGSNGILGRMHRGYTREQYMDRVARLRERIPDVTLSTDIIVGFPGETDHDFELTMEMVRLVRPDSIFSFIYSPRPDTPAAEWPDDVSPATKKDRLHRLQRLQDEIQMEKHRALEGSLMEVLVDGPSSRKPGQVCGRTSQNHLVNLPGDPSMVGRFVPVKVTHAGLHSLTGLPESHLTS